MIRFGFEEFGDPVVRAEYLDEHGPFEDDRYADCGHCGGSGGGTTVDTFCQVCGGRGLVRVRAPQE